MTVIEFNSIESKTTARTRAATTATKARSSSSGVGWLLVVWPAVVFSPPRPRCCWLLLSPLQQWRSFVGWSVALFELNAINSTTLDWCVHTCRQRGGSIVVVVVGVFCEVLLCCCCCCEPKAFLVLWRRLCCCCCCWFGDQAIRVVDWVGSCCKAAALGRLGRRLDARPTAPTTNQPTNERTTSKSKHQRQRQR